MRRGDAAAARVYLDRAIDQTGRESSDFESYFAGMMIAEMERWTGSSERAKELAATALRRVETLPVGHPFENHVRAILFRLLGALDLDDGDLDGARRNAALAYAASTRTRDLPIVAAVGVFTATISRAAGAPASAAHRLGAADRLRGAADSTSPDIKALAATLRDALGDDEYERLYDAGRALGRDEAIAALDPTLHD